MIEKSILLLKRYRELVMYAVFGVLTTIVNWIAYVSLMMVLSGKYANITAVAVSWVIAVLFAYATNRKWVFQSKAESSRARLKECGSFFASRALTGLIDLVIMYVAVDLLRYDGGIVKLASNVLIIILNYLLSKFIIFKKQN